MIVYLTTNKINNKQYVGQDSREISHYYGSGQYLRRAIKKYGKENFVKITIVECRDKEEMNRAERFWIKKLNTLVPNGYNIALGGTDVGSVSEETKKKISNTVNNFPVEKRKAISLKISLGNKGKKQSEETRKKIGIASKNISNETRKKIGIASSNRSDITRKKLSLSHSGLNNGTVKAIIKHLQIRFPIQYKIKKYFKPNIKAKKFLDNIFKTK